MDLNLQLKERRVSCSSAMSVDLSRLLAGDFSCLPSVPSNLVRIFLSSTFSDTSMERNALIENCYRDIRAHCLNRYGVDFQVVDMRWGIRGDSLDDHKGTQICLREVQLSQEHSLGPNFIVLLGQRYGAQPLNPVIPNDEMQLLLHEMAQIDSSQLDNVTLCYKKDENASPPVYVLQNISSIVRDYAMPDSDGHVTWTRMELQMTSLFKAAAERCLQKGKMDKKEFEKYLVSVTEREVLHGIFDADAVASNCLVFLRTIDQVNVDDDALGRYGHWTESEQDREARELLDQLRAKLTKIPNSNGIFQYRVTWCPEQGLDKEYHQEYLKQFCSDFKDGCLRLIHENYQRRGAALLLEGASPELVHEVVLHGRNGTGLASRFFGRTDILEKVRSYILHGSIGPLVLYGEPGSGKTAIMAKAALGVQKWIAKEEHYVIVRFLGTTPRSSSLRGVLLSIWQQVTYLFNLHVELPSEPQLLASAFRKLLHLLPKDKHLCLFLDSLDQLTNQKSLDLAWLPQKLPSNLRVVLSTVGEPFAVLRELRHLYGGMDYNFTEILPFSASTAMEAILGWFQGNHRCLTADQTEALNEHLRSIVVCFPLHAKLIFEMIREIPSFEAIPSWVLVGDACQSIQALFASLRKKFGDLFVRRALGYMTACKHGLTEQELEDILSLDDDVLTDTFEFHVPPIRRMPYAVWARLKHELREYIVFREADGVQVMQWYHSSFESVADELFVQPEKLALYQTLAEYFMGTWSGKAKEFRLTPRQMKKLKRDDPEDEADRLVPEQKIEQVHWDYDRDEGILFRLSRFNERKINELPLILLKLRSLSLLPTWELACRHVYFNYGFLRAKLICSNVDEMFYNEMKSFLNSHNPHYHHQLQQQQQPQQQQQQTALTPQERLKEEQIEDELILLFQTLLLFGDLCRQYEDCFAAQITSRLLPFYGILDEITTLIDQCDTDGIDHCALVPVHHQLETPGTGQVYHAQSHKKAVLAVGFDEAEAMMVSVSDGHAVTMLARSWTVLNNIDISHLQGKDKMEVKSIQVINQNSFIMIAQRAVFVLSSDEGQVLYARESSNDVLGVAFTDDRLAIIEEGSSGVPVFDIERNELIGQITCPKEPSALHRAITGRVTRYLWLLWQNGDISVHNLEEAGLDSHLVHTEAGVRALSVTQKSSDDSVVVLFENGMVAAISLEKNQYVQLSITIPWLSALLPVDTVSVSSTFDWLGFLLLASKAHLTVLYFPKGSESPIQGSLQGHFEHAIISNDGHYLVAGRKGTVHVFQIIRKYSQKQISIQPIIEMEAHQMPLTGIFPLRNKSSTRFVTCSEDGSIKEWDLAAAAFARDKIPELERMQAPITKLVVQSKFALVLDSDRALVAVWNITSGKMDKKLRISEKAIHSDAVLSNSELTAAILDTTNSQLGIFTVGGPSRDPVATIEVNRGAEASLLIAAASFIVAKSDGKLMIIDETSHTIKSIELNCSIQLDSIRSQEKTLFLLASSSLFYIDLVNIEVKHQVELNIIASSTRHLIIPISLTRVIVLNQNSYQNVHFQSNLDSTQSANKSNALLESWTQSSLAKNRIALLYSHFIIIYELPSMKVSRKISLSSPCQWIQLTPDGNYFLFDEMLRNLLLIRVEDGACLARFPLHADITSLGVTRDSRHVLVGAERRVFGLLIVDPDVTDHRDTIKSLPSRQIGSSPMKTQMDSLLRSIVAGRVLEYQLWGQFEEGSSEETLGKETDSTGRTWYHTKLGPHWAVSQSFIHQKSDSKPKAKPRSRFCTIL